ncbi:phage holin [Salinicoccus roseus]|uniref:PTS mannose transporter subunit IID n=1 Tax=Salinicoccus roseus TaxID=45670 RepID=A0A0C2HEH5_9STAP|nr:phage holin [Salinicoccus roseus]KIH70039.1 PTS mannose transporter subunit IID [Salinicoccus roseus]MDB0581344.1 phage holin [Salinicoccus roseus]
MTQDKLKQLVAMIGGFLGALFLALQGMGIHLEWFSQEMIDLWMQVLMTAIPLAFAFYGIWKNTFIVTKKARRQEEELNKQGLK